MHTHLLGFLCLPHFVHIMLLMSQVRFAGKVPHSVNVYVFYVALLLLLFATGERKGPQKSTAHTGGPGTPEVETPPCPVSLCTQTGC